MNKLQNNQKGFTIIEVVLVLAIAGLIFLMVFIALPALQRSQRDTARKNDASTVASAVNSYKSNNRGKVPTSDNADSFAKYVSDDLNQTDKVTVVSASETGDPTEGHIFVYPGKKCEDAKVVKGNARTAAVVVWLEGGGKGTLSCTTA